jgi:hypothetical protein
MRVSKEIYKSLKFKYSEIHLIYVAAIVLFPGNSNCTTNEMTSSNDTLTVGVSMVANCAPLLAYFLLYSYELDFIQWLLKKNEKKPARSFNLTFGYIDDVLSLNNSRFGDFVYLIYPIELELKDTTDTDRSASYLDLHLEIDSEGRLRTYLYDKRDDFNFPIVNFPFICSNIPAALA